MSTPTWPATLPQAPHVDGYQEQPANRVVRSSNDVGPANTRPRSTSRYPFRVACTFGPLSETQLRTFVDFFEDTLVGGALSYRGPDRHGDQRLLRIMAGTDDAVSYERNNAYWNVRLKLEVLGP